MSTPTKKDQIRLSSAQAAPSQTLLKNLLDNDNDLTP